MIVIMIAITLLLLLLSLLLLLLLLFLLLFLLLLLLLSLQLAHHPTKDSGRGHGLACYARSASRLIIIIIIITMLFDSRFLIGQQRLLDVHSGLSHQNFLGLHVSTLHILKYNSLGPLCSALCVTVVLSLHGIPIASFSFQTLTVGTCSTFPDFFFNTLLLRTKHVHQPNPFPYPVL